MENDLVDLDELDKLINEIGTKKGKKNTLTGKSRTTCKSSQPRKLNDFDDLSDFNSNDYELPTEKRIDAGSKTNKTIKCFPHCYASSDLVGLTKHNKIRFGYYMK